MMTLPTDLNKDLEHAHTDMGLLTADDLERLGDLAQDRGEWSDLVRCVLEAGEGEVSFDV